MICESCGWTAAAVDSHGYSCCDYAALGVTFLAQERDALQQKLDEAVELLRDCEHADNSGGEYSPTCPICDESVVFNHKDDCALGLFFAAYDGVALGSKEGE